MRAKRRDDSEADIVAALEAIGCDVIRLDTPCDLLIGYRARNILIECKTPGSSYKGTKKQQDWIKSWRGQVRVCRTPDEAIDLVTQAYKAHYELA